MNRIDPKLAATLRQPAELVERGLAPAAALADLETGRRALCDRGDARYRRADRRRTIPTIRSRGSSFRARGTGRAARARTPIRSAMTRIRRSPASCIAIPTGCCSSWSMSARYIAGSVSAAKWSGRARRPRCRDAAYRDALDYIRAHPEIWEVILTGGDPLMLSPRRLGRDHGGSRRHRSRQDHPHPYPRAGGATRAHRRRDGRCAEGRGRDDLGRRPRQPSARTDRQGPRRLRAAGSTPAFPW